MKNTLRLIIQRGVTLALTIFISAFMALSSFAAPKKDLWNFWNTSDERSSKVIDHELWRQLPASYVKHGEVLNVMIIDYGFITPEDITKLRQYTADMSALDILSYNKNEQMAYWINIVQCADMATHS